MLVTTAFKQSLKQLKREHNKRALEDLAQALDLINSESVGNHMDNHSLKNANGLKDLHLDGGRLILLYKYIRDDVIAVSAKLHDVVDHTQLNQRGVFDEKPAKEYDYEEVKNLVKSSTSISELDRDELDEWIHSFYNDVISKVLLLDFITLADIIDNGSSVRCTIIGTQYSSLVPIIKLRKEIYPQLCKLVKDTLGSVPDMYYYNGTSQEDVDDDAYDVEIQFDVPLEEVQE